MTLQNDKRKGRGISSNIDVKIDETFKLELPKDVQSKALIIYHGWIRTSRVSFLSIYSYICVFSFASLVSFSSALCFICIASMFSGLSIGSLLSFGSIGSMMSIMSVGSFASIGCIGESFKNCMT